MQGFKDELFFETFKFMKYYPKLFFAIENMM